MVIQTHKKVRSYRFVCKIQKKGNTVDIGCNEISGLEHGIETSEVPSGRIRTMGQSNPDSVNHLEVTLRRGVDRNQELWNWWNFTKKVARSYGDELTKTDKNFKREVVIKSEARKYTLKYAFPTKYSVSDFDAQNSSLLFEEVTLKAQDMTRSTASTDRI